MSGVPQGVRGMCGGKSVEAARLLAAVLVLSPAVAWSAEGGTTEYLGGFTGFAAGYVPPEAGIYYTDDVYFYSGKTSVLAVNGRLALDVSADVYLNIAQVSVVTQASFLGGNYAFGLALPLGYVSMDVGINPIGVERSANTFGLGDVILVPAAIGWHQGNWHTALTLSVFAPWGQYDDNQAVNLSKHFWAIDGAYSASYLTMTGLDLSGSVGYTTNFENSATHYKSGDVAHLDVALGQNLTKQFKVGIAGYAVVQVTDDSGSGATLGAFKSNVYGAGPALFYSAKIGSSDVSLQLRWYREFDAKNHLEGNAVYLTGALKL
jgi:hypothetical protein